MDDVADPPRSRWGLVGLLAAGAAVAVSLGVAGDRWGEPRVLDTFGFTTVQSFKSWVATGVLALVGLQLLTASWMYRWLPGRRTAPRWVSRVHRTSGVVAILASLPVAFYCLYGFGFDSTTPRTLIHSVAGCVFYGAFVAKMLALRTRRVSPMVLPLLGGLTFTAFVLAWWSAAWWWFQLVGWVR